jgi:hypothetical protein
MKYFLELQKYIKENPNWETSLKKPPYSLIIKKDEEKKYVIFNYVQTLSDLSLPLCREARGIILKEDTAEVKAIGFNKFFNYRESLADSINWEKAFATEKIDGSLIKIYKGEKDSFAFRCKNGILSKECFSVATNGTIDAFKTDLPSFNPGGSFLPYSSFGDLVYNIIQKKIKEKEGDNFSLSLDPSYTYLFEVVSPYNRVVVPYKEENLYLIGMRNIHAGEEVNIYDPSSSFEHPELAVLKKLFNIPRIFRAKDLKEKIEEWAQKCDPLNLDSDWPQEGFVVIDDKFHRIKIKGESYLSLHKLKGNGYLSPRDIVDSIKRGDYDDILGVFPEFIPFFREWEEKYRKLFLDLQEYSLKYLESEEMKNCSRKEYAQKYALSFRIPFYAFQLKKLSSEEISRLKDPEILINFIQQFLKSFSTEKLLNILI